MDAIYHAEGRLTTTNNVDFSYEYTLKDHLGNARVSFRAITNGTAIQHLQENHYYPFGMEMEGAWQAQSKPTTNPTSPIPFEPSTFAPPASPFLSRRHFC